MSLLSTVLRLSERISPAPVAYAHCDIPCGIYDPHGAQVAAHTVIRMNQLIEALPKPGPNASPQDLETYSAKLARYIATKDEHAELCKRELRILWGDYFRPEHLQQYPDLHTLFWNAMKLGSRARQEINMQAAQDLLRNIQQIAEIFWKTKGAEVRRQASRQPTGGEIVYPAT
ncbi:MAG: superoxide dismutase, Ni [Chloroflexi bacterium]|nr:superoxide dismutase, Ni [Chloroflexota bacterium]